MSASSTRPTSLTKFKDCLRVPPIRAHPRRTSSGTVCGYRCIRLGSNCTRNCRYMIRDAEEVALRLPAGPYEIPLLLQDRNLETAPDGSLTGRLLHKIEDSTMEFFGPFTLVNGIIWPHLPVEARQYRLRLLNGSNARIYRLVLLDASGTPVYGQIKQIGTDGGLLGQPVDIPRDGLLLSPAERADLIVDFRAVRGQRLTLVNTAGEPFDNSPVTQPAGMPDLENRLPFQALSRDFYNK